MKRYASSILALSLLLGSSFPAAAAAPAPKFRSFGQNFYKADGSPRTLTILLFDGMTTQDFVGIYSILNFVSGKDLKIQFAAKKKGLVQDERGRLKVMADYSIDDIERTDLFVVPGGNPKSVLQDKQQLAWIRKMYDSSEYTASICTGSILLGAAGATTGLEAGTAWAARHRLAEVGMKYVPTPPPARQGKYFSAAGAAAGIEIGLSLLEEITGNRQLSEVAELAAEWNPHMLYGSGDPEKASPQVLKNFAQWSESDPLFKDL